MAAFHHLQLVPWTRINDDISWCKDICSDPVMQSHRHDLIPTLPNDIKDQFQPDFAALSACDIVVETVFDYPYPYVSEKTLRPIACKRMFVIVGAAGTLDLLKSKGFETWGDFVDETYDKIPDPNQRFLAVMQEIYTLCARPLAEIVQYLTENHQRTQHNFDCLMSLQQQELLELEHRLT